MRSIVILASVWGALQAQGDVFDRRINLPNSFERKKEPVPIHIRHRHHAVLTCLPQAQGIDPHCVPTHQPRDASTSLRLEPVKSRKLRNRSDGRASVDVRVTSEGAPAVSPVLVAPGAWDVVWSGLPASKRFSVESGHAVRVELETTTGRCERVAGQCYLRSNVVSKTADVTVL